VNSARGASVAGEDEAKNWPMTPDMLFRDIHDTVLVHVCTSYYHCDFTQLAHLTPTWIPIVHFQTPRVTFARRFNIPPTEIRGNNIPL
jgi:hypothetical protein